MLTFHAFLNYMLVISIPTKVILNKTREKSPYVCPIRHFRSDLHSNGDEPPNIIRTWSRTSDTREYSRCPCRSLRLIVYAMKKESLPPLVTFS